MHFNTLELCWFLGNKDGFIFKVTKILYYTFYVMLVSKHCLLINNKCQDYSAGVFLSNSNAEVPAEEAMLEVASEERGTLQGAAGKGWLRRAGGGRRRALCGVLGRDRDGTDGSGECQSWGSCRAV